jgi:hypothetical protein
MQHHSLSAEINGLQVRVLPGSPFVPAMKTAGRETPNRRAHPPGNRAHGAGDQNKSCLINWAAKQEKFQPQGTFFLLTSTFIELIGT